MAYTTGYFEPVHHCPEAFLGNRVCLPELEGYTDRMRSIWENPILDMEQAAAFMELAPWFVSGYDKKLTPAHWGVVPARTLEAMFFRLVDMVEANPRWGHREEGNIAIIKVHCEGSGLHNLARDLTVSLFHPPGTDPQNEDYLRQAENPACEGEYLSREDEGNARVRAFWEPLPVPLVVNALAAWDALRWAKARDAQGKPRRFTVDVAAARSRGVVSAMSDLFGPAFKARTQALTLDASSATATTPAQPGRRL